MTVERWFGMSYFPNDNPPYIHPYADDSWGGYFANEGLCAEWLSMIDVFHFWPLSLYGTPPYQGGWLSNLLQLLKKHKIKCDWNTSGPGASIGSGATAAATDLGYFTQIEAMGGTVDMLTIDGFPLFWFYPNLPNNTSSGLTQAQANTELVAYFNTIRATRPNLPIGLDTNMPYWGYKGIPANYNPFPPYPLLADYSATFESMRTALNGAGYDFRHLQVDFPYDYFSYAGAAGRDWLTSVVLPLSLQVQGDGLLFGIFLNSQTPETSNPIQDNTNYFEILDYVNQFVNVRGGKLDQPINMEWNDSPTSLLPVHTPFTQANIQRDLLYGGSYNTPVWFGFQSPSVLYYFTDSIAERNGFLQNGYQNQSGVKFYLPGGNFWYTPQDGLSPIYLMVNGTNLYLATSQGDIQFLLGLGTGWTYKGIVGYGALGPQ